MEQSTWNKSFHVFSIRRSDLQNLFSREQIELLTDGDMKKIAEKLAHLHADVHYWDNLESVSLAVITERQEKNTASSGKPKNLCTKRMTPETAYEVWQNGTFTYWVLKKYQAPEQEAKNLHARWYCAVVSPFTGKTFQYGDTYVREITVGGFKIANPLAKKQEEQ